MDNSTEWVESTEHPGYQIKTIKRDGFTLHVLRPTLDEKEKKKRESQLKSVTESILADYYKRKEQTS